MPRLLSRQAGTWIILALTVIAVLAVAAYVAVTQPQNAPLVIAVIVVLARARADHSR